MIAQLFFQDVLDERARQDAKYPTAIDRPDGAGVFNPAARKTYEDQARLACDRAGAEGRVTHSHVFEEEAAEVLTAAAAGDVANLKTELVQVAALCLLWAESIAKREARR